MSRPAVLFASCLAASVFANDLARADSPATIVSSGVDTVTTNQWYGHGGAQANTPMISMLLKGSLGAKCGVSITYANDGYYGPNNTTPPSPVMQVIDGKGSLVSFSLVLPPFPGTADALPGKYTFRTTGAAVNALVARPQP